MLISDAVENPVHRGAPWQAAGGQHYSVFNETAIVCVIPGLCTADSNGARKEAEPGLAERVRRVGGPLAACLPD